MIDLNSPPIKRNGFADNRFEGFGRGKLIIGGILFLAITIGIFWYLFHYIEPGEDTPSFDKLRWVYLILALPFLPVETLLSSFRMWLICRVLQPELTFATCLKADLANSAIAVLTPFQTGGGAGQIYILNRGGAKVGTALTISLLTFVGTMIALFGMGIYALFLRGMDRTGSLFVGAVITLTTIAALMVLSVILPAFFRSLISGFSRFLLAGARPEIPFAGLVEPQTDPLPATCRPYGPLGDMAGGDSLHLPGQFASLSPPWKAHFPAPVS